MDVEKKWITRRQALKTGGAVLIGASFGSLQLLLQGCGGDNETAGQLGTSPATGASAGPNPSASAIPSPSGSGIPNPSSSTVPSPTPTECLASTNVTRGPYFVDHQEDPYISGNRVDPKIPQRSDIRIDTEGSAGTQLGVPLNLTLLIGSFDGLGTCAPLPNAQVHIWHCNAKGAYSGVSGQPGNGGSTTGQNFLRGYQMTDSNGKVSFQTIFPGWYSGRTVHIHIKVRLFDSFGNITTEATTQLFFNDSVADAVFSTNPAYSRAGTRDTRNPSDGIYAQEDPTLLVALTGSPNTGFTGTVSLGVEVGTLFGG